MEYFLYAIPLIPILIISWIIQHLNNKAVIRLSNEETNTSACSVAQKMLDDAKLNKILVEKGESYTQNIFDEEKQKILLSPDVFDQKDITAIGLAAKAAGMGIFQTQDADHIKRMKVTKSLVLGLFWLVFTVLAFGLMGKHLPTVITGYSFLVLMFLLYSIEIQMEFGINRKICEKLKSLKLFTDVEIAKIARVLRSEAMKLG